MPVQNNVAGPPQTIGTGTGLTAPDLIEKHADRVYNLAVRLTGDREEARDLAQDVFIRILKGAASFRGEASERTWICQIVINCHRNRSRWWRRLKRGKTMSLDQPVTTRYGQDSGMTLASTLADPSPGADRIAESAQTRRRLEAAIRRLPEDQRAALLMREVEEMSYAEIATALGVREGTVKSRLARARDALRRVIAGPVTTAPVEGGTA